MIKLFEMFAGYGGASFALKKANIEFECIGYSEIDKFAIKCFNQNFPGIKNFGDCTKIDPNDLPDFDLLTGGFPCQDVSIAGKRDLEKGRTNLYKEILRIAEVKKPKYMVLENVAGLISMGKSRKMINVVVDDLKKIGYGVIWEVLNSREHGIPQNRERVIILCKYGGWKFNEFRFPIKEKLNIFVKDILEESVDQKYMLTEKQIERIKEKMKHLNPRVAHTLTGGGHSGGNHSDMDAIQFDLSGKGYNSQEDRVYNADGVMCCIPNANPSNKVNVMINVDTTGNHIPNVPEIGEAHRIYDSKGITPTIKNRVNIFALRSYPRTSDPTKDKELGRFQNPEFREDGCSNSITTVEKDNFLIIQSRGQSDEVRVYDNGINPSVSSTYGMGGGNVPMVNNNMIFRRLTPKECFRLMGFLNDEISLEGISDSQKYKLAGNGWDINLFSKVFKSLYGDLT